ncbi:FAD-binding oxidoreductase [Corticibacter populi]|uniref:FAD-binding oxidoreductase n=1 Tax=Corticibacter populi TaxID=1550736 RepID=A0A3M6QZ91_9BURK|nr:FAD-dependent oxidoreductase [Corticibacter populi]RMX08330.1 FAD-binding oxidoreductase [Corticibacter populi]RZS35619.1 D-amino-acid dehydrogenase [Corticibacter populi]
MGKSVIVLGAGMVGTSTAVQLARRGHDVVLVDRRSPGRETSYGNAGLIQSEAVEPYGFPQGLAPLLRVIRKQGIDVNYHLGAMPGLTRMLERYWLNSTPRRYARIVDEFSRLIRQAIPAHAELIALSGAEALVRKDGWIKAFRGERQIDEAIEHAQWLQQEFGVPYQALDQAALAALEPGLHGLQGGMHWTEPWSVRDPGALVAHYARYFASLGGRFVLGDAASLRTRGAGWAVQTDDGWLEAGQAVIALGPWAAGMTRSLGYRLPLFIKRGYHLHYACEPLRHPLLDADNGYMLVPMERGLRLTTGAEFARLGDKATPVQVAKAEQVARQIVELGEPVEPQPWMGARPCTVDMKPVIGAAPRHPGLWFHFGHAHQGFTLGPATAQLLAQLIDGETPCIDPQPYSPERFLRHAH